MAELAYTKNRDYLIPDLMLDGEEVFEEYPSASTVCCTKAI